MLLGAGGAYGVYLWVDPVYRASTLILVEPQRVPSDYIKPTVTSSLDDRLRTIEQQIKNRENLDQILRETGLYPDLMADGRVDEAIRKVYRNLVDRRPRRQRLLDSLRWQLAGPGGGRRQLRRRYLHRREPPAS